MNKQKLKAMCLKIVKETGLSYNSLQTHYFLESILEKIANSSEKQNFIVKGGFLLSNVIGIGQRTTVDMDFSIRNFKLTAENVEELFIKILVNRENEDNISYEIMKVEEIRKEDEYGGYCITILCKLDNIKQIIPLDIATGDPITPTQIDYEYISIFGDKSFNICAYNIETILAEKMHTIYARGAFNSRSKDFYDVYILYKLKRSQINFSNLKKAFINTFEYRGVVFDKERIISVLNQIQNEPSINMRWENYQKKYPYSQGISFDDVMENINKVIEDLDFKADFK